MELDDAEPANIRAPIEGEARNGPVWECRREGTQIDVAPGIPIQ
jgi:hypothetical protein